MDSNGPLLAPVTLRQLQIFAATVDTGSAGRASRLLGLSQPAVTLALGRLEQRLGQQLLERGQGGTAPTAAGLILHRRAGRLRLQLVAALAQARQAQNSNGARYADAITTTQVACHTAIAEHGAFKQAAQALGISLPALQRTARGFEQLAGVPLYHRMLRHIGVTAAGEQLAQALSAAMTEIAQARDEIDALMGLGGGRMAMGCLPLMPKPLLAKMFSAALAQNPNLSLTLEENSYGQLVRDLRRGKLDLVLGALRRQSDGDIDETALFADPYVVAARNGHILAGRKRLNVAALQRCGWVVAPVGTPRRIALEHLFSEQPAPPRVVLETNSVNMTLASVLGNDFLTVTSRSLAIGAGSEAPLAILNINISGQTRTIGYTTRRGWLPTAAQAAFLTCVRQFAPEPSSSIWA